MRLGNNTRVRALIVACVCALHACTTGPIRDEASMHSMRDAHNDAPVDPFRGDAGSLVAFVFVSHECPIANAMMPDIRALARSARERGVAFYAVHPAHWVDEQTVRKHSVDFALAPDAVVLRDPSQVLTRALGATITPEAALIRLRGDGTFERLYLGRFSDLYAGIGRRKASATTHDFSDAIASALAGELVHSPQEKAIGCFIELQPQSR